MPLTKIKEIPVVQETIFDCYFCSLDPIAIRPEGDKIARLEGQSTRFEAGQVFLPREAAWLDLFLNELLAFPNARHDDQVDSVSQFLKWRENRWRFREETDYFLPRAV